MELAYLRAGAAMRQFTRLIAAIIICQVAGLLGSLFTTPAIPTWYATLHKPWFTPPNWVFAPAWTTLFVLMGLALYLVWSQGLDKAPVSAAVLLFGIQLTLNVLWSALFFGLHSPFYAFIEIIALWAAILLTIIYFWKVSRIAGILLLPYLFWVSFASILNFYMYHLNA